MKVSSEEFQVARLAAWDGVVGNRGRDLGPRIRGGDIVRVPMRAVCDVQPMESIFQARGLVVDRDGTKSQKTRGG